MLIKILSRFWAILVGMATIIGLLAFFLTQVGYVIVDSEGLVREQRVDIDFGTRSRDMLNSLRRLR